jgi:phosphoribosylanthranilate isomerase
MRTRIKFCGLVRPADVAVAVDLGVDAVGFVFYPRSPRHVDAAAAKALRRSLPSFVCAVGLFVNAETPAVRATAVQVGLDVLQFHGDETLQACEAGTPAGMAYWRAVRMRGPGDLLESAATYRSAEALLLDSHSAAFGGTGRGFDWDWIGSAPGTRIILAGGMNPDTVGAAIARVRPFAVDVSSGIQGGTPREKDPGLMERFVAEVAEADRRLNMKDSTRP